MTTLLIVLACFAGLFAFGFGLAGVGTVNGALLASMRISGKARLILISRVVLLAAGVAAV